VVLTANYTSAKYRALTECKAQFVRSDALHSKDTRAHVEAV